MTTELTLTAPEDGVYVVNAAWKDEDGLPVTPNSASWSLVDEDGAEINGRTDVVVTGLSTDNDIVLSGADLGIPATYVASEYFIYFNAKYEYTSSLGTLTQYAERRIPIENHRART